MLPRKQINLILTAVVLLFSVIAIVASDSASKSINPFASEEKEEETEQVVIDREVKGDSDLDNISLPPAQQGESITNQETIDNSSENQTGYKVAKVVDGDTIDVNIDGKVERLRLIGIDTPETVDPRKKVQCFGKEASKAAKELLLGKFVSLESDETQGDKDKYKRLLRYVILADGTNFNLFMIAEGYAYEYTYDLPYKYQAEFKQAQKFAAENQKGLWSPATCSGNK